MASDTKHAPTQKIGSLSPVLADEVLAEADPSVRRRKSDASISSASVPPDGTASSIAPGTSSMVAPRPSRPIAPPETTPWVRILAIALCVLLVVASVLLGYIAG